jgi:hypothetical protein
MGLLDTVVGAAKGYVLSGGNPVAAFAGGVQADQQAKEKRKLQRRFAQQQAQEAERMADYSDFGTSQSTLSRNLAMTTPTVGTASSGEGFFSTIRSGLRETGGFISDVFSSGIPQLFGVNRPRGVGQQPAITTVTNVGAQESQGSGSIQAGMGVALPSIISGARGLLKTPLGQLGLGTAAGAAVSLMGPDGKTMRVTRKMKSQARMVVNLAQGNLSVAADILGISEDMLVAILLKRFRNDGPVVTKAALRKTKQTIRRLHNMQDVLKSITPTAAGRRRAPMKRASTITQIKN